MNDKLHLYEMTYWESYGTFHVNDVHNLCGHSAKWYAPMRILQISIEEYIDLLLKYNAKRISYYEPTDYLAFSFDTETDAKRFCSFVNKIAKAKKAICL